VFYILECDSVLLDKLFVRCSSIACLWCSSIQLCNWTCFSQSGLIILVKPKFYLPTFTETFPLRESRRHKSWKSRTQTISTCQAVCDRVRAKSATNPFVVL